MKILSSIALLSISICLVSCGKIIKPRVVYLVEGTASQYSVSYQNADGDIVNVDTVPYYWSISFDGKKGDDLMISATGLENNCWVKVYIYSDGKLLGSSYEFGNQPTASVSKELKLVF